jgi:hypothetical protein
MSEDGTVLGLLQPTRFASRSFLTDSLFVTAVFFTKFDIYQLEPLVGSKRAQRLLAADKATHLFA